MQEALLTTAHSTLFPGASQLIPIFVHTPALPRAAVALCGFVIALLVTPRYEGPWGNKRCNFNQRHAEILGVNAPQQGKRAYMSEYLLQGQQQRMGAWLAISQITGPLTFRGPNAMSSKDVSVQMGTIIALMY